MSIKTTLDSTSPVPVDQSLDLDAETLALVMTAMQAGLTEFTTPTPGLDEGRIDWGVKKWVFMKSGMAVCHLVAFKQSFNQFEILGPEVKLGSK